MRCRFLVVASMGRERAPRGRSGRICDRFGLAVAADFLQPQAGLVEHF
jgi:hypothetical protein